MTSYNAKHLDDYLFCLKKVEKKVKSQTIILNDLFESVRNPGSGLEEQNITKVAYSLIPMMKIFSKHNPDFSQFFFEISRIF